MELKERHQVLAWKNTSVDKAVVNRLVSTALHRMPSKQNIRRCNVTLIDMSIGNRRNIIYETTMHTITKTNYGFNPQVLSPWILCLGPRESVWNKNDVSQDWFFREASLEIGLIAGYITLLAPDMGLGTSFCSCIKSTYRYRLDKILGYQPELFMGIGIEDTQATDFYCPARKMRDLLPRDIEKTERKPPLDAYYKVI